MLFFFTHEASNLLASIKPRGFNLSTALTQLQELSCSFALIALETSMGHSLLFASLGKVGGRNNWAVPRF